MNKFLRVLFVLVIIAMSGAIIFQLFFPSYMGSHSGYGISVGWQREIGIWNVAVLVILDCCQSQIRLVLSSDGSIGFDPRWAWNWDQSSICSYFQLSSAGQWDRCA